MQHLRRADPIEHGLAGLFDPGVIDRGGQGLPRRHGGAERAEVRPFLHRLQHRAIGRRGGEADGGLIGLDDFDHVRRRRLFQQGRGGAEAEREDGEAAQAEGESQGGRADEHVIRRHAQHLLRIAVRDHQDVAVKMHRRFWGPRGAGGEAEKADVVPPCPDRFEPHGFGQRQPVEFGVMVGGAVEADDGFHETAVLRSLRHLIHQAGVAERELDLRLVDNLGQLARAQERHGVHHHRPRLRRRQPAGDHRGVVGGTDQNAVAGPDAKVLGQRMGQPVRPVRHLFIGAPPSVADQGGVVAEPVLDHLVCQFDANVQVGRVVEAVEQEFGQYVGGRKIVPRETVEMGAWSKFHHIPAL